MNMQQDKIYKKMQENLPDYVFGRLTDSDKLWFEENLSDFPDIQEEIKQVKAVFNRIEKIDFRSDIEHKTRNLSVKVMDRMDATYLDKKYGGFKKRVLYPAVSLAVLMIVTYYSVFYNPVFIDDGNTEIAFSTQPIVTFNEMEVEKITGEAEPAEININNSLAQETIPTVVEIEESTEETDEIYEDFLLDSLKDLFITENTVLPEETLAYNSIPEVLEDMNEDDFQDLLEVMSNANFKF